MAPEATLSSKSWGELTPIAGDASSRKYYRLKYNGKPAVLADYTHNESAFLPFMEAHKYLCSKGFSIPAVFDIDLENKIIVLEDLGDKTGYDLIISENMKGRDNFYKNCLDMIIRLQNCPVEELPENSSILSKALDSEKLLWELNFMKKHYLEGLLEATLSDEESRLIDDSFRFIAERCAAQKTVLCHRDFHSKNLYWRNGAVTMIDYQDLLPGPYTYDAASLLRDSYIKLEDRFVDEMKEYFYHKLNINIEYQMFESDFEMTALQRNLKAIGTFASQKMLKGNAGYIQFISPTLANVKKNINRFENRLGNLKTVLEKHIKELL